MKIAIVSSFRKECGIGTYSFEFLKELIRKIKSTDSLFCITHNDSDLSLNKVKMYKVIDESNPLYIKKVNQILKKENPDVIDLEWEHNIYSPLPFLGTFIFPLIYENKEKIFLSLHSLYKEKDFYNLVKEKIGRLAILPTTYYFLTKKFFTVCRKVRVFTYYEETQLPNKNNAILIPQGFKERKPFPKPSFRGKINLLIFGFIRETKNYNLAISSLSLLEKNFRLLIVGKPLNQRIILNIKKSLDKYKVKDRVKIIPTFVSQKEKLKIFQKSHIILLPYKLISNSGVLIDSLEYGRPTVSTVLKEDLEKLKVGEFSDSSSESFSNSILKTFGNYSEYYQNILAIRENFFWKNVIEKIINAYREIINS